MDLLIHTKHNLLISNNLDEIWFWKNIPITFHRGVDHTVIAYYLCNFHCKEIYWWTLRCILKHTSTHVYIYTLSIYQQIHRTITIALIWAVTSGKTRSYISTASFRSIKPGTRKVEVPTINGTRHFFFNFRMLSYIIYSGVTCYLIWYLHAHNQITKYIASAKCEQVNACSALRFREISGFFKWRHLVQNS